jgi:tRNA(Ile)-lysidine synthase
MDSTVLAHALQLHRRRFAALRFIHIDHGLQPGSEEWSRHCARLAKAWRVPFSSIRVDVRAERGQSLEAVAREARYAALARAMRSAEVLVTAQHQDDQAETLLLQLFRGAGVAGLAAMPGRAPFARGFIARPLLSRPRVALEQYARSNRLEWVEDPTNQDETFARNFLRQRVMPLLVGRWSGLNATVARSARHLAEAAQLLEDTARRDLNAAMDGDGLNVAVLRRLEPARRRSAMRSFILRAGMELPSTAQMKEITGPLLTAREDAQPQVRWGGCSVARRAGRLELRVACVGALKVPGEIVQKSWRWKRQRQFVVNEAGDHLTLVDDRDGRIDLDKLPAALTLRPRRGGERLRVASRARTQTLKKLLQAARFTVEERDSLPLLFAGKGPKGRLIAAGDRWVDASVQTTVKSRRRARLVWTRGARD